MLSKSFYLLPCDNGSKVILKTKRLHFTMKRMTLSNIIALIISMCSSIGKEKGRQ